MKEIRARIGIIGSQLYLPTFRKFWIPWYQWCENMIAKRSFTFTIRKQAETYRKEFDIPDLKFADNESLGYSICETNAKQKAHYLSLLKIGKRNHCMESTLLGAMSAGEYER